MQHIYVSPAAGIAAAIIEHTLVLGLGYGLIVFALATALVLAKRWIG